MATITDVCACVCVCGGGGVRLKELLRIFIFRGSCIYEYACQKHGILCMCAYTVDYTCGSIFFNLSPHHVIRTSS